MGYNLLIKEEIVFMMFPVKRVKDELVKEFAISNMTIDTFAQMHSIKPEALRSWIDEITHPVPGSKSDGDFNVFSTNDFVELDIPAVSKQSITLSKNRKDLITIRAFIMIFQTKKKHVLVAAS